jgi:hypothetical protein
LWNRVQGSAHPEYSQLRGKTAFGAAECGALPVPALCSGNYSGATLAKIRLTKVFLQVLGLTILCFYDSSLRLGIIATSGFILPFYNQFV